MKELWIQTKDNLRLKTYINNPKQNLTAIISCHGFTGSGSGPFSTPLAERLSEKYLVCRFDFRGQGQSEGRFYDSSITRELEDLDCVVSYVREKYEPRKIIIMGHSFGAAIGILYAAQHAVDGFISVSGEGDLVKGIQLEFSPEQLQELERNGKTKVVNWSLDGKMGTVGKQFLDDMRKYSTIHAASKISCPTLIIHGTNDDVVPMSASEEIYDLIPSEKEFIRIDDADHCFNVYSENPQKIDELARLIDEWMNRF